MTEQTTTPQGRRVREARTVRGLSQKDAAAAIGVKQASLSDIELGKTVEISGPVLVRLAKVLGVRADWIVTGRGPKDATNAADLELDPKALSLARHYPSWSQTMRDFLDIISDLPDDRRDELIRSMMREIFQKAGIARPNDTQRKKKA